MGSVFVKSRSRLGCSLCRQNRVKCDEYRPSCRRCKSKGLPCRYSLTLLWPEECLSRGIKHGRAKAAGPEGNNPIKSRIWASTAPASSTRFFINTKYADMDRHFGIKQRQQYLDPTLSAPRLPPLILPQAFDHTLVRFFDEVICSTSTFVDAAEHNPYRDIFMTLLFTSPIILNAVQAISARILSMRQGAYRSPALHYYSLTLNEAINAVDEWSHGNFDKEILCAWAILLCWFEISEGVHGKWICHLTGLSRLLLQAQWASNTPCLSFSIRYFSFHFVLASTVYRVDEVENLLATAIPADGSIVSDTAKQLLRQHVPYECNQLLPLVDEEQDNMVDTYTGLSSSLLNIMLEISRLAVPTSNSLIDSYRRTTKNLKSRLESLEQRIPEGLQNKAARLVGASAEAYRQATLLFLHHKTVYILGKIRSRTSLEPLFNQPTTETLVKQTLDTIEEYPNLLTTAAIPLWPLFMAGISSRSDELRSRVCDLFSSAENNKRFGNIPPARKLIKSCWKQVDLCSDEPHVTASKYSLARNNKNSSEASRHQPTWTTWDHVMALMGEARISLT